MAFEGIGGVEGLRMWALKNRDEFYKLYARLIPMEVQGEIKARIQVVDDIPPK